MLADVMYSVEATFVSTSCKPNEKVGSDDASCSGNYCDDYKKRAGDTSSNWKTCAAAATVCDTAG